jgi:hypothetical protein
MFHNPPVTCLAHLIINRASLSNNDMNATEQNYYDLIREMPVFVNPLTDVVMHFAH